MIELLNPDHYNYGLIFLLPLYLQNPEPQDFYPKKGPQSGGTLVTITGLKMDTGRYITAQVAGRSCTVDRIR